MVYFIFTYYLQSLQATIHGNPKKDTWTRLASSAYTNDSTLTLEQTANGYPDWAVGEEIVVAPSGWYPEESEIREIAAYDQSTGTLTLTEPLLYDHLVWNLIEDLDLDNAASSNSDPASNMWWYNQREFAPEVGLLTHNIVIQGKV